MAVNASFVSPTADAKVAHMVAHLDTNSVISTIFNGFSFWRVLITLVVLAVTYDQGMENVRYAPITTNLRSHVHLAQGLHRWTCMEGTLYWAIPRVRQPRFQEVPREMGLWRPQLCLRLPQVWLLDVYSHDLHTN